VSESLLPVTVPAFPPAVELLVRERAGDGDARDACCEPCGLWLGRHGGRAWPRMAGGPAAASNAVLLCGSCLGRRAARDPRMEARGWWIRDGLGTDPRLVPVAILVPGTLAERWLGDDGSREARPGWRAA
jgi:hypothetical protein